VLQLLISANFSSLHLLLLCSAQTVLQLSPTLPITISPAVVVGNDEAEDGS
tara:strand:+ start:245 stop:397 length:153 start_codon:yes stop_codon:yes gene_type:complete